MNTFFTHTYTHTQFDYDHYSELISDMKWMEAKTIGSRKRGKKKASSKSSVATSGGESGRHTSHYPSFLVCFLVVSVFPYLL